MPHTHPSSSPNIEVHYKHSIETIENIATDGNNVCNVTKEVILVIKCKRPASDGGMSELGWRLAARLPTLLLFFFPVDAAMSDFFPLVALFF